MNIELDQVEVLDVSDDALEQVAGSAQRRISAETTCLFWLCS